MLVASSDLHWSLKRRTKYLIYSVSCNVLEACRGVFFSINEELSSHQIGKKSTGIKKCRAIQMSC